jgi:hypothetical protein
MTTTIRIAAGNSVPLAGISLATPVYATADGWLTATITANGSTADLRLTIDPQQLAPGRYTATVRVSATNATSVDIAARIDVGARPVLRIAPESASVDASAADSAASRIFTLSSSVDSIAGLTAALACDSALSTRTSVTLSGTTTPASGIVRVAVNGAPAGNYRCTVRFTTSQQLVDSAERAVALTVRVRSAPIIALEPGELRGSVQQGSVLPLSMIAVSNGGAGVLDGLEVGMPTYSDSASSSGWIGEASLAATTAPTTLVIALNTVGLATGTYKSFVPVTSTSGAATVLFPIVLTVTERPPPPPPPPPPPHLVIQPGSLSATCHMNSSGDIGSVSVSVSDGSQATLGAGTGIISSSGSSLVALSYGGVLSTSQIPGSIPMHAVCGGTAGSANVVWTLRTTSGLSGSMSVTVTVVP